ncbi:MAG: hypothetical protein ACREQM_04695 [Candidatus Dormibacteraceae bacterium]
MIEACGASGPSSGHSHGSASLTQTSGKRIAVDTWVKRLNSFVALDPGTLSQSESGGLLTLDKQVVELNRAQGNQENQYQPTGKVDWVAYAAKAPQMEELARIEETWVPAPGTSVSKFSDDELVVFSRPSVKGSWRASAMVTLAAAPSAEMTELRGFGGRLPAASQKKLPIAPEALPAAYQSYIQGAANSHFAPGQFTDVQRNQFAAGRTSGSSQGVAVSYQLGPGRVEGVYGLPEGNALVFFTTSFTEVYTANPNTCMQQVSSAPNFPPIVPDGRYQSVHVQKESGVLAVEDPSTSTITIIQDSSYPSLKASTTPATAPICL